MTKLDSHHLGELFRELRLARGLKMKDVTSSQLSQAQLSKFENGQTMLSADKLISAISAIHMSLAEFEHAYYQYEPSAFFQQAKLISHYHSSKDIEGLERMLINFEKNSENNENYNRLNRLVIECAIHDLKVEYKIKKDDKEFIASYLYSIEEWTEYELYIFGNTLHVLSNSDLIFLGKGFCKRNSLYMKIPENKHRTHLIILNIIFELLERGKYDDSFYFMNHLDNILGYQDMFSITVLNCLKMILDYQENRNNDLQLVKKYISDVNNMGYEEVANFLRDNIIGLL